MAPPAINIRKIQRDMLARGWHQGDLATAARVSPATLTRFFSGEVRTAKTLKAIAAALDQPIAAFLGK